MATRRRRLDVALVDAGLVSSRSEAVELIDAHRIRVNGAVADKASRQVSDADQLHIEGPSSPYVGRGAYKLLQAIEVFNIDVSGRVVLDAGASTGGFTDLVLQLGARHVYAVDVGHGQLHQRLRADPRVTNMERTNVRHLGPSMFDRRIELVVGDLSFISLKLVIAPLLTVIAPGGHLALLVKPQFEAGRAEVGKGRGVIRDDSIRWRVRGEIDAALRDAGCTVLGWTESPISGADGNREFLVYCRAPGESPPTPDTADIEAEPSTKTEGS